MNYFAVGLDLVPENGGPTKSVPNFARALGGQAVSFTYPDRLTNLNVQSDNDIEHIRSVKGPLGRAYLIAPPSEIKRLDTLTADAQLLSCHILYRHSAHWVASRAKRRGIPYWVVPHGCLDPYVFSYGPPVKRLWMRLFGRRILREASAVIFSTQREREKAACWLDRDNGHVVHWPVELPDQAKEHERRGRWRLGHGFTETNRVLLSLGRLHSMKRPLETIDAVASAADCNLHLVFIGPEGNVTKNHIMERAQKLGIGERVRVLPPIYGEAKFDALFGCDAYISLSTRENFNNAAAEALAVGRPVLLSPGNDLGAEVYKNKAGMRIKNDSITAATETILEFSMKSNDDLKTISEMAKKFAQDSLSPDRFKQRLTDIFLQNK